MDIIVLKPGITEEQLKRIVKKLERRGLKTNISKGTERTIIGVIGDTSKITEEEENAIRLMPGIEEVMRILKPYKLASRDFKAENTTINVRGHIIGGKKIQVIAGPCAVENKTMLMGIAEKVKNAGATFNTFRM
jgi:3-deoxy-7-phosphoheptulonate synthase